MTWFISLEDSVVKGHRGRVTLKGNSVVMWQRAEDERNRKVSAAEQWQSSLVFSGARERIGPHCYGCISTCLCFCFFCCGINTILSICRQAGIEHNHWWIVSQSMHQNGLSLLICVFVHSLLGHISNRNIYLIPGLMRKLNPLWTSSIYLP
jgi:hypothetical protein